MQGITSRTIKGKDFKPEEQWRLPNVEPNPGEERLMMAVALEIQVKSSFRLHTYTFCGVVDQQIQGCSLGACLTMTVTRVVMELWRRRVRDHLQEAGG